MKTHKSIEKQLRRVIFDTVKVSSFDFNDTEEDLANALRNLVHSELSGRSIACNIELYFEGDLDQINSLLHREIIDNLKDHFDTLGYLIDHKIIEEQLTYERCNDAVVTVVLWGKEK